MERKIAADLRRILKTLLFDQNVIKPNTKNI